MGYRILGRDMKTIDPAKRLQKFSSGLGVIESNSNGVGADRGGLPDSELDGPHDN